MRIDHAAHLADHRCSAATTRRRRSNEFGNAQINRLESRSRSLTFGAIGRPRPNLIVDLRFNASHAAAHSFWQPGGTAPLRADAIVADFLHNPGPCDDFVRFAIAGAGQLARRAARASEYQTPVSGDAQHHLNRGVTLAALRPAITGGSPRAAGDEPGSLSVIAQTIDDLNNSHNLWSAIATRRRSSLAVKELSLCGLDTWRITPGLTLNAGLRWEYSPSPLPREDAVVTSIRRPAFCRRTAAHCGRTATANFAPRLGLAWRPGRFGEAPWCAAAAASTTTPA